MGDANEQKKHNYYLVKGELSNDSADTEEQGKFRPKKWEISYPPLFTAKTQSGLFLQAIRDLQFSMIMPEGSSVKLYLVKTRMKPYDLIDYFQKEPDWLSYQGEFGCEDDLILLRSFDYLIDPEKPTQSDLTMTYQRMVDGRPVLARFSNPHNQDEELDEDTDAATDEATDESQKQSFLLSFPAINLTGEAVQ